MASSVIGRGVACMVGHLVLQFRLDRSRKSAVPRICRNLRLNNHLPHRHTDCTLVSTPPMLSIFVSLSFSVLITSSYALISRYPTGYEPVTSTYMHTDEPGDRPASRRIALHLRDAISRQPRQLATSYHQHETARALLSHLAPHTPL